VEKIVLIFFIYYFFIRSPGIMMGELKKITLEQLKQYDGQKGRPAYIAYKGKVYEVTNSDMWEYGEHFSVHLAGQDVTDGIDNAPHGEEKLEAIVLIGELIK
jgi:predicted heme/steroid binding protein